MRIYACAAITLFALLVASALAAEDSISVKDGEDFLLRTMQVVADANETSDGQSEMLIWNGFREKCFSALARAEDPHYGKHLLQFPDLRQA